MASVAAATAFTPRGSSTSRSCGSTTRKSPGNGQSVSTSRRSSVGLTRPRRQSNSTRRNRSGFVQRLRTSPLAIVTSTSSRPSAARVGFAVTRYALGRPVSGHVASKCVNRLRARRTLPRRRGEPSNAASSSKGAAPLPRYASTQSTTRRASSATSARPPSRQHLRATLRWQPRKALPAIVPASWPLLTPGSAPAEISRRNQERSGAR